MKVLRRLSNFHFSEKSRLSRFALVGLWVAGGIAFVALLAVLLQGQSFPLLQTRGEIARRERDLLVFATLLAVFVLVPVYAMLFGFAWRYRSGHKKDYKPEWDSDKKYEAIWWGIPIAIIGVLATVTWTTSHSLDPFKALASSQPPLKVQVVALQWKWLFIYPEQNVASVNEVVMPVGRPVEFSITSDAPMNSFWIPQLGGQIYAMAGMTTKLNLIADMPGDYKGVSSNISGKGFADMRFTAKAVSAQDFDAWVESIHEHENTANLDMTTYNELAKPGTMGTVRYHLHDATIYDQAIMKYMGNGMKTTEGNKPSQVDDSSAADASEHMHAEHNMEAMQ